jgi:hypothetical protein
VAPAVFGLVDRGAMKRPELAAELACQIELRMSSYPRVRLSFERRKVLVEDAPANEPPPPPPGEQHTLAELGPENDEPPGEPDQEPDTLVRAATFNPDLIVSGSLADIVAITAVPLVGGLPSLRDPRGRSALASVAAGRIRFSGSPRLVRRLLMLLQI